MLIALELLENTHSLRTDYLGQKAFQTNPSLYIQEIDNFVSGTVKNLTRNLLGEFEYILPNLQQSSAEVETARSFARTLLLNLDNEKARISKSLRNIPWWDRFTLSHYFERSRTYYFTGYSKFLAENEPAIRFYAEGVQIVADNLLMLIDYVSWYRTRQVRYATSISFVQCF